MNVKNKVIMGLGPLVVSLLIIVGLLNTDISLPLPKKEVAFQATARNYKMVTGRYIRNQILSDDKYVPFYSSSEMAVFDEFHPSVLAEKYDRSYRPFIAGRDAQGALSHFLEIQSTAKKHQGKKVVYMVSPNSFQLPNGMIDQFYDNFHSELEIADWLLSIKQPEARDTYAAKRLLGFKTVKKESLLAPLLKKVAAGETLSTLETVKLGFEYRKERSEDNFYSIIKGNQYNSLEIPESNKLKGMYNFQYAKKYKMSHLPDKYNFKELDDLAYKIGEETSKNNEFGFFDLKFEQDLGTKLPKYKGARKNKQYTNSVEYSDLQLVLQEFAELEMDPLFVIVPIDSKFLAYTETPPAEIAGMTAKLKEQLTSQGFHNIAVIDGDKEYTYVDPAHIGRRAWLEVDTYVNEFLTSPTKQTPTYKLNNEYYSEEWAQKKF